MNKYLGMTVSERLYVSGLLKDFDAAVSKKDIDKVKEILRKVDLTDSSIKDILEALGLKI